MRRSALKVWWSAVRAWLGQSPVVVPDLRPRAYEGMECAICLVPFDSIVPVRTTDCGHTFHTACLSKWARYNHSPLTCPSCRGMLSFRLDSSPSTARSTRPTPRGLTPVRNEQMGCLFVYSEVDGRCELVRSVYDDGYVEYYVVVNGREQRTSVERPDGIVMHYNAVDERLERIVYPRNGVAYFEGRAGFEKLVTRKWANGQVTAYSGDAGRECPMCEVCALLPTSA